MPALTQTMQPGSLGESDLQLIEHALLDALLDVRSDRTNALDQLLQELDARGANDEASIARREQMEALLAAAVMDRHPNRNRALDRILDQIPTTAVA